MFLVSISEKSDKVDLRCSSPAGLGPAEVLDVAGAARVGQNVCTRDPNTCQVDFCDFPRCLSDRESVIESMVRVHLVSRELAQEWVAGMDDAQIEFRIRMYTGMESSAEDPNRRVANVRSTRFSRPTTMTAGLTALDPVPELPTEQETRQKAARFGGKEPGPMVDRALSASH